LLAICERAKKAQLTIYNLLQKKKQRVITGDESECQYTCQEFVQVAFCPKNPERYLLTLNGEPDYCITIWQHDMFKMHTRLDLAAFDPYTLQLTEQLVSLDLTVAVTGLNCFYYLKINENMGGF
jgi:hypothetical protein